MPQATTPPEAPALRAVPLSSGVIKRPEDCLDEVKKTIAGHQQEVSDLAQEFINRKGEADYRMNDFEHRLEAVSSSRIVNATYSRSTVQTAPSPNAYSRACRAGSNVQYEDCGDEYDDFEPSMVKGIHDEERLMSMHAYLPPDKRERCEGLYRAFQISHDSQPAFCAESRRGLKHVLAII